MLDKFDWWAAILDCKTRLDPVPGSRPCSLRRNLFVLDKPHRDTNLSFRRSLMSAVKTHASNPLRLRASKTSKIRSNPNLHDPISKTSRIAPFRPKQPHLDMLYVDRISEYQPAFAARVSLHQFRITSTQTCLKKATLLPQKLKRPSRASLTMRAEDLRAQNEQPGIPSRDWREFRAALVAGSIAALEDTKKNAYREGHWAHPLSVPETGCFLASHPAYYRRTAPYLTQAVVFLTSYSPENGATGLVLNRPLMGSAAELESVGMFGRNSSLDTTVLAKEPVYAGGPDVSENGILTALHGNASLLNGLSILQPLHGVYISDALQLVTRIPQADVSSVRLFAGCIRWKRGELEREVDEGSWFCISASKLFALKHCLKLPKPLWVEIMQSQGHPFAKIANRILEQEHEGEETEP